MSRITHPASAYLLIPLLEDDSFQIRKTALTSLLQLKQRFTAESVLAAVCVDLRLSRTLFRIMKKQTQQECNVIFDAFEKAANFHPDLEDALPALHELAKRSLQQCNQPEIDMQRLAAMNLMKMKCRENRQSEIYQSDSDSTDFHQQWSSEMTEPVSFRQIRHDMLQPLTSNSVNEQVSSTAAPQVSDFKAMETRRSLNLSSVRKKLTQMLSATSLHWALSLLAGASLTVIFMPASQHSAWLESTDDFLPDQFPQHLRNAIKSTRNTSQMPPEVELSADTKLVPDVKSAYPAMRFADSSQGDHHQNTPSSDVK